MKKTAFCLLAIFIAGCASPSAKLYKAYDRKDNEYLFKVVQKSSEPWIIEDGAYFLGENKCKEALPMLLERLTDQNLHPRARAEIAIAVSKLGDNAVVPNLITALESAPEEDERCRIITALSWHCTEESIAALQQQAQDSQIMVSRSATNALAGCKK